MKTIYLAGKLGAGEGSIRDFSTELEGRGHTVLEKWFEQGRLPKPYLDHPETSTPASKAMKQAAFDSDVTIMFPSDDILGAAIEYGIALGSKMTRPDKQIVLVNPFEVRQSVFYADQGVLAVKSLADIRRLEWY